MTTNEEKKVTNAEKITIEELNAWQPYIAEHLLDILNGEISVEEQADDIRSFRNTIHYTGNESCYKPL